jgi:nitrogen regulatory protein P-II 1
MKKIEATIQPFKLEALHQALADAGVDGMTVSEVQVEAHKPRADSYRGASYAVPFTPKIKIELVVADDQLARCVSVIERSGAADDPDCGAVIVLPVEDVVRIRTGEHLSRAA